MFALGELLLGDDLSSDRLGETHDPRRLRICRTQMIGVKCDPNVTVGLASRMALKLNLPLV
jgi:hypothetical protein